VITAGIGFDDAGINGKALTADQACGHAQPGKALKNIKSSLSNGQIQLNDLNGQLTDAEKNLDQAIEKKSAGPVWVQKNGKTD
jgi:hypothetical protein